MALAREARGDAKSGELNAVGCGVDEHIGRLEILVNQPTAVELPDRAGQRRGDSEELSDLHRLPDEAIERLATGVVDHEQRLPALAPQFQRPQCPGTIQITLQFVFVREAIDVPESRVFNAGRDGYERVRLALSITRESLQNARAPSRHSTSSESSSQPAPNKTDALICPAPPALRLPIGPGRTTLPRTKHRLWR